VRNLIAEQGDIDGSILTLDALHATGETLEDIRAKQAHFLVSVKDNRAKLLAEAMDKLTVISPADIRAHTDKPKTAHGRTETRSIRVFPFASENPNFATIATAMLVHRHTRHVTTGKITQEDELYVSSLHCRAKNAEGWLTVARGHWQIENGLHHVKDRTMKEDRCTAQGESAVNMSTMRSLAVHLLQQRARFVPNAIDAFKANVQKAVDLIFRTKKHPIK